MFMYIYKITNLLNGKIYIGKHTCKKYRKCLLRLWRGNKSNDKEVRQGKFQKGCFMLLRKR